MMVPEENDFISRVGFGTPVGTLMREYWLPAMLSSEIPNPDSEPVRVMLLGERLIGFRDTSGRVGLIQNACPHRGASLFYGRNEENGLRCIYHGWKYDVHGKCIDMPNEPDDSNFKQRVKVTTYPTQERAGIVWAYLGPRTTPPPLPGIEGLDAADGDVQVVAAMRSCNWLQGMEGDLDTTHSTFLHSGHVKLEDLEPGTYNYYRTRIKWAKFVAIDTDFGTMYGCSRPAGPGDLYWRMAQYLFPCFTHTPGDRRSNTRMWVPMDDHHTMYYSLSPTNQSFGNSRTGTRGVALGSNGQGWVLEEEKSSDWFGRFNVVANEANDYQIDRNLQRTMGEYSGVRGIWTQDHCVTESMGPILDRTVENLGTADMGIIQIRRRIADAARDLQDHKVTPPGVDNPEVYRTRSVETILPEDVDWLEGTKELRRVPG